MKSVFIALLSMCFLSLNAQISDSQLLNDFINSNDYSRFLDSSKFKNNGTFNLGLSNVTYHQHPDIADKNVPVLNLNFTVNENRIIKIVGQIQAIKVKNGYSKLPSNGSYFMLYRDYRQFNLSGSVGTINVYDLNYDEYLVATASFSNGENSIETFPMTVPIAEKYGLQTYRLHPCDENANGNVTWGECFRCMVNACYSNPQCAGLCTFANQNGNQCTISIGISCIWLAIEY